MFFISTPFRNNLEHEIIAPCFRNTVTLALSHNGGIEFADYAAAIARLGKSADGNLRIAPVNETKECSLTSNIVRF